MKPARSLIPIGTATLLPLTAQSVRRLEDQVLAYLGTWGYQEIILPTFEFLDVLSVGLSQDIIEKCYKFPDWTSGRTLILRPDATAQIARMVAMGLGGKALPVRFSYRTTVFRYEPEHQGRDREIFQVGVEMIGQDSPIRDAELVTVLNGLLQCVGLNDWTISLGHVGFFTALLAQSGLSQAARKQAEVAAAHKDLPHLEEILLKERVVRSKIRQILQVPERCGGYEVLEWGRKISGKNPQLLKPLTRLTQVYDYLKKTGVHDHVLLDLGEFRGFDYYDGLVFDVFTSGRGRELGGGGRYDHLVGRFGRDLPAIGFGIDLDRLFSSLELNGPLGTNGSDSLLMVFSPSQAKGAFALAQELRGQGVCVIEEMIEGRRVPPLTWATKVAKERGMKRVIIPEGQKPSPSSVHYVEFSSDMKTSQKTRLSLSQLLRQITGSNNGDL